MHNLSTIARGWYKFIKGSPDTKLLMSQRLAICDTCPNKVQISALGKVLVQVVNENSSLYQCGLCGCPLMALTADAAIECKEGRWPKAGAQVSSYFP